MARILINYPLALAIRTVSFAQLIREIISYHSFLISKRRQTKKSSLILLNSYRFDCCVSATINYYLTLTTGVYLHIKKKKIFHIFFFLIFKFVIPSLHDCDNFHLMKIYDILYSVQNNVFLLYFRLYFLSHFYHQFNAGLVYHNFKVFFFFCCLILVECFHTSRANFVHFFQNFLFFLLKYRIFFCIFLLFST